jgi:hypothetical protein
VNEISKIRPESELRRVPLAAISIDPSVQQRVAGTSEEIAEEYAQAMREGDEFPAPVVFSDDDGATCIVGDGFHRLQAYRLAHPDAQGLVCELRSGDREDAMIWACGANTRHGLRLSRLDKLKAITTLLNIEKCSSWSDRQIARQVGVSHPFVAKARKHLQKLPDVCPKDKGQASAERTEPTKAAAIGPARRRTVMRRGKSYVMQTGRIGGGRGAARPRQTAEPRLLSSLAWSAATKIERKMFVDGVGWREIAEAFNAIHAEINLLERAWQAAGPAERQSFAKRYLDEITALAAAAPERPASAAWYGDPLAIPTFLRRDIPNPS